MTPKLLSAEGLAEVARAASLGGTGMGLLGHLLAHIAALEADNAAHVTAAKALCVALDHPHYAGLNAATVLVRQCVEMHSPGSHLLAEHAKALVRAFNEGVEECCATFDAARRHGMQEPTASDLRAFVKRPES